MSNFTYDDDIFSDLYKDAYGFRPHGHVFYDATPEVKQEIWDGVLRDLEVEMNLKEQMDQEEEIKFTKLVNDMIELGAKDQETAIRWILDGHESFDCDCDDVDYALYLLDLSFLSSWRNAIQKSIEGFQIAC